MSEPILHRDDRCSYERRTQLHHPWIRCRHQLPLILIWLTCSGFSWPGRVPHLSYQAAHGTVPERVEALRLLEEYPSQASSDACLAGLEDGASEVRLQAAQCVGAAGDGRATSNLLDLASSKDPAERAAALEALGRLAPPRALSVIEPALADQQPAVRVAAVRALTAYVRDRSFDIVKLAPLVASEPVEVRLAAVAVLAAAESSDTAAPTASAQRPLAGVTPNPAQSAGNTRVLQLRAAARDRVAEVRAAALRVMGAARDANFLPDLSKALSDSDEAVRLSAIAALGDSDLASATPLLRPLSAAKMAQASQLRAARTAIAALGRSDDPSALSAIVAALMRVELTESAAQALIARARRLNQPESFRQSAEALQRAIVALQGNTPPTNRAATPTRSDDAARTNDAPQTNNASLTNASRSSAATRPSGPTGGTDGTEDSRRHHLADAALDALGRAITELAPFTDVRPALIQLTRALASGRGEVYSLTQHLIALCAQTLDAGKDQRLPDDENRALQLLPALLAREAALSPPMAAAIIAVLESSSDARALLATHRELLVRLVDARPAAAPAELELHTLLHVSETETSLDARRALAGFWARQPSLAAERDHLDRLVRWLDDADADVRERSSVALSHAADIAALQALSARLARAAPDAELTLRACAGTMLRSSRLPSALRERLLQQFQTHLSKPDEAVAMSALIALRATHDQRSAYWIAGLLRGSSTQLRAAAVQALAGFDQPETRRMLRDMLRGDNTQNASNAALALAELGSDRDVEALLRAAERGSWPLPPAAAYAAARITARAATRKHSLERVLCRFAQLRDSYALSNIVSALATLGADACDENIEPKRLLDPTLPSVVRISAASWLQSTRPHSPEESAAKSAMLSGCAGDHDDAVATACKPRAAQPELSGQTLLRLFEPDARSPLRSRMVALRLPDASVFVGQSDDTGFVLLPRATAGEIRLEDPADHAPLSLPVRAAAPANANAR